MTDPMKSQVMAALVGDVTPQSPYHVFRLVCGGFMGAVGLLVVLGKLFVLRSEFSLIDAVLVLALIGGGAAVVFTRTMLAILAKVPLPGRKS